MPTSMTRLNLTGSWKTGIKRLQIDRITSDMDLLSTISPKVNNIAAMGLFYVKSPMSTYLQLPF